MRFLVVSVLAALLAAMLLVMLPGCGGGGNSSATTVAMIVLSPTIMSLNEGGVATLSVTAENSSGAPVAADISFVSSNSNIATVSSGGIVCGGIWDPTFVNCNPTIGQAGVGQVTITAISGKITATATVYVHLKVDRVVVSVPSGCVSAGQAIAASVTVYSTSAPGCSTSDPCNITSTVGPISLAANDETVAAYSSGINPTYSSSTDSPTYSSGGTITGSKGQTCNLSNFTVGNSGGIDPTFSSVSDTPTYISGGVIVGSSGQTCDLSDFNNGVTGATAVVALTGTDAIAASTVLTITAEGSGGTKAPTTATLSNGTATCSGTANVKTMLNNNLGIGQGVIGATATVALTGTNVIAAGTQLTITNSGYGATSPPTAATLSNGTAMCSGTANVTTQLTGSGVFTAQNPGSTTVSASVSGVNSVGVPYLTCPVAEILVRDANSNNTSFTLGAGGTQPLTADVYDTNGQYIKPTLTWGSSSTAAVTVAVGTTGDNPATITAAAPGTAYITAACSDPDCNINVPAQYSLNVVTASVTGTTSTTVYAASTNSTSLVPISTSTNAVGTAITLPNLPNSLVADPAGTYVYLGSASGLMTVQLATGTVTTYPVNGTIEAISPDSVYLLISDSVGNDINYFDVSAGVLLWISGGFTTHSSGYTPDSKYNEWVTGTLLGYGLQTGVPATLTLPYTANALGISGQGGLTYITGSKPSEIDVRSTCNHSEEQTFSASAPTLIAAIPNATGAVAADSPALDVISTPSTLTAGCPVTTKSTLASVDMKAGGFTGQQLFFSSDSSHAWLISNLPGLLSLNMPTLSPIVIPYAGGATAYSGGITLDGAQVYVGASDGTVHRIDVASGADVQQIAVNLKDANGNVVPPNLVIVQP